jgi:peptidyl-prolyl cis-trans isomerase A (cyclophilin A)
MRKLAQKLWTLVRGQKHQSCSRQKPAAKSRWRPWIELLEDRLTPASAGFSNTTPSVISGHVFLGPDNAAFDAGDTVIPGAVVTLSGTTTQGTPVNVSTTSDSGGAFTFFQVQPGTYSLSDAASSFVGSQGGVGSLGGVAGSSSISFISVAEGQAGVNYSLGVAGVVPGLVSLRQFLNTSKGLDTSVLVPAGSGVTAADNSVQPSTPPAAATSSLGGSVVDSSNHGIAGVTIALTGLDDTGRALLLTTTTDTNGAYEFTTLPSGIYSLDVTSQPSGFRADLPTPGTLGGVVFRNDQINDIKLTAGAGGTGYKFGEIPLAAATGAGPVIVAALADDTSGPGGTTSDGITSDPSVEGTVALGSPVTSFQAGFDSTPVASFTNILGELIGGAFFLNPAFLAMIAGGQLSSGAHVLHLLATNAQGQSSSANVSFTLENTAPTVPTLHMDATSDPGQSGITASTNPVTLSGHTSPGVQVTLTQGSTTQTVSADSSGNFTFTTPVTLKSGANDFTVQATDVAGNTSQLQTFFLLESPPVAVPTSPVTETVSPNGADVFVPLSSPTMFKDGNLENNTVIRFDTSAGPINVQLDDTQAPQNVANFLSYIEQGAYNNDIFHRLVNGFVIQGGGFTFSTNPSNVTALTAGPTVPGEPDNTNRPAVEGTIAMALSGNGTTTNNNSGTDEFFFNLADNTNTLSTTSTSEGDFTIFGKVVSGADQRVVNTLAADSILNESKFNGAFDTIPMQNYSQSDTAFPTDTTAANFALIKDAVVVRQTDQLTYTVASNSNSGIVTATINHNQLDLHPTGTGAGSATVVVNATDRAGNSASITFSVTVTNPISFTNPGAQSSTEGKTITPLQLTATDSTGGTVTFSQNSGLPPGLNLSASGQITGTVSANAQAGSPYTTSITSTDGKFSNTQTFQWTISPAINFTNPGTQNSTDGQTITPLQLAATDSSGGTVTFTLNSGLPTGLSLSTSGLISGQLAGNASSGSPYTTSITAGDGTFSNTQTFQWIVAV